MLDMIGRNLTQLKSTENVDLAGRNIKFKLHSNFHAKECHLIFGEEILLKDGKVFVGEIDLKSESDLEGAKIC